MSHKDLLVLRKFLFKFRMYIRGYIFVSGVSKSIVYFIAAFLVSMLLDRLLHFDPAQRLVINLSFLVFLSFYTFNKLVKPLFVKISDDYLCRKIEKRYTEFKESIITGHYFVDASLDKIGDISFDLSASTLHLAAENSSKIKLFNLFDYKKLFKQLFGLCVAAAVFLCFTFMFTKEFNIWVKRNLFFENIKWPYQTVLYVDGAVNYKISVPYKSDVKLKIMADSKGQIPDQISINQILASGDILTTQLAKVGSNSYFYSLSEVTSNIKFTIEGNDYASDVYEIVSSIRPEIEELKLMVHYPKYLMYPDEEIDINQSVLDVLEGSTIKLIVKVKNEVKRATLVDSAGVECTNIVIEDKIITCEIEPDLVKRTTWSFNIFDNNGFDLYQKIVFDVVSKKDQLVSTNIHISKLGNVLTPVASFDVKWDANDDFGIYKIGAQIKELDVKEVVKQDVSEDIEEDVVRNNASKNGVFKVDLEKYKITAGSNVVINIVGQDFKKDRLSHSYSNVFRFQIITDQEFQKYLFDKEEEFGFGISLMRKTMESMLSELILQLELSDQSVVENKGNVYLNMQKKIKELTLKNQIFIEKFEIIVNEIKVNKFEVYNEADLKRINEFVLKGLHLINDELFPLELSSLAGIKNGGDKKNLTDAKKCCEMILNEYQRILKNIRRAEGYYETVTLLKEVIKSQKDLLDKTKDRKNDKIEGFFDE